MHFYPTLFYKCLLNISIHAELFFTHFLVYVCLRTCVSVCVLENREHGVECRQYVQTPKAIKNG